MNAKDSKYERCPDLQLNKQSFNLNREFRAKFNIISKEINTPPQDQEAPKVVRVHLEGNAVVVLVSIILLSSYIWRI